MQPISDLSILNIEVTQAIQCIGPGAGYGAPDNSLMLNSDRDVAVRVYIGHNGKFPGASPLGPALKDATVTIRWVAEHEASAGAFLPTQMSTKFNVPNTADLNQLRNDQAGSATFIIPAAKLGKPNRFKSLWVEAEVTGPAGFTDTNPANNSKWVQLGGRDATGKVIPGGMFPFSRLKVLGILVHYHPKGAFISGWPDMKVAANAKGLMEKTYPMDVDYSLHLGWLEFGPKCTYCKPIDKDTVGFNNSLILQLAYATNYITPKPDVLFGWLPKKANGYLVVYGLGTNSPPVAWLVEQADPYRNEVGLAHETGHTQGMDHTDSGLGCSSMILEAGFDLGAGLPVPSTTYDYMGDSGPNGWISPCMWSTLTGGSCLCPTASTSGSGSFWPKKLTREPQSAMLVSGTVDRVGRGAITGIRQITSQGPFPPADVQGRYSIVLADDEGEELYRHGFDLRFRSLCGNEPVDEDGFFLLLPRPEGLNRVRLEKEAEILDERTERRHRPEVRFEYPEPDHEYEGEIQVTWRGRHEDDANLEFDLLYSPDNGESWGPIAIALTENSLRVDTRRLRGRDRCRFRLLASDGFSTTSVDSEPFALVPEQPIFDAPAPARYVGDSETGIVHDDWAVDECDVETIIRQGTAVCFAEDDPAKAEELGYRLCRRCFRERGRDNVEDRESEVPDPDQRREEISE